jgi:hypothetical protein
MDLDIFSKKISTLSSIEGEEIRSRYIKTFVDFEGEFYKANIETKHKFSDGYCYTGYLWDCLVSPIIISQEYLEATQKNLGSVYVFWDIHSCERIFIDEYWKFGKDSVLQLDMKILMSGKVHLPEDIYIFDESFDWTLILTHEHTSSGRYCLKSGVL